MILFIICLMVWPLGVQADFTTDSNAIEKAAQSVLMLACSNKDGSISTGSGFVAFNSQTLVTNCHVMDEAKEIVASDDNGNLYVIDRVYCVSEHMDIAILGFAAPTALRPLPLSTGDDLQRGQPVVTIGSPEGLKNTVSTGVVSSLAEYGGVPEIQISAPISHGSSGGALFDANGHVVGVTSSGLAEGQNLNFAVRSSVPLALYAAWKGETYTFNNWPKESPMDFNAGEKLAASAAPAAAQVQGDWLCPQCGQMNSHNFCQYCGTAKPQWQCACGQMSVFKFCGACGKKQETLLGDLNGALTLMDQKEYEKAAAALEQLGEFNCGGLASQAGLNVSAEDQLQACYYNWGLQLETAQNYTDATEKYRAAGTYADAPQRITEMAYLDAEKAFKEGAYLTAAEFYLSLMDNKDYSHYSYEELNEKLEECTYQFCLAELADGRYETAEEFFLHFPDYKDSSERILEVYYVKGLRLAEKGDFLNAIEALEKSEGFNDALEKLGEVHSARVQSLIDFGDFGGAITAYQWATKEGHVFDEPAVLKVNHSGKGIASVLKMANDMGFLKLAGDEETYCEEYLAAIIEMEKSLGLNPDGIIYLNEYEVLRQTIYPGATTSNSDGKNILGALHDLGYISLDYQDMLTYSMNFKSGVKKAEKDLNLTVDGILTVAEQEVILAQRAKPPKAVKSLKISTKTQYGITEATLSWPKVKDAVYYSVFRNGELYIKTDKTKYSFVVWNSSLEGSYTVLAEKYTVSAEKHSPAKQVKMKK